MKVDFTKLGSHFAQSIRHLQNNPAQRGRISISETGMMTMQTGWTSVFRVKVTLNLTGSESKSEISDLLKDLRLRPRPKLRHEELSYDGSWNLERIAKMSMHPAVKYIDIVNP